MRTITSEQELLKELEKVRARGYAIDDEETAVGLRCVASVIFDENAEAIAGISVSGPSARITDQKLAQLGEMVMEAAFDITQEMGGRWVIGQPQTGDEETAHS
jgi:IclR family acetate operon transcriptional repressor